MMHAFYNRQGEPVSPDEWAAAIATDSESFEKLNRVALSTRGEVIISTVFMGINHGDITGELPPLIFETLVMGGEYHGAMVRYSTEAEALAGHDDAVEEFFV